MNNQKKLLKTLIFAYGILFLTDTAPITAQERIGEGIKFNTERKRDKVEVNKPRRTSSVTTPKSNRTQKVNNKLTLTASNRNQGRRSGSNPSNRLSDLSVITEPGAMVSLVSLNVPPKTIKPLTADQKRTVVFEDLTAGRYKIKSEKDGFVTQEQDVVEITPGKTYALDLDLTPITYNVTIETNINDGEVRYAPAEYLGEKDGKIVTKDKESGVYCFAPIKNKKAVIKGLNNGYYNIDIRPDDDDIEYSPALTAINITNETVGDDKDSENNSLSYKIELQKQISQATFNASAWTNDQWDKPSGWILNKLMKTDGLSGVALPRNPSYRYYADFEMVSDVRLLNADTVGFVVRAEDEKNYYLIQISGAKTEERHVLKFYVVTNDKREQLFSVSIANFAQTIAEKNFRVIIKGKGNMFNVYIEDIANGGSPLPVGDFPVPNNKFPKGAVGIAGSKNSNFEVGGFTVCARKCNF